MKHSARRFCKYLLLFLLPLIISCTSQPKRFVIGVSQCSEDVWREKLNEELRIAALYYNDVDLRISSANDNVQLQTEQINKFVDEGVDLLIVAPGQVSISPAIDRAYEKGIPVIIFDRRTRSNKYTAYIGADNKQIGSSMGEYLAGALTEGGRILELCGLSTSSPAIERKQGFDSLVACRPGLSIVEQLNADWTEEGAFRAIDSLLSKPHNEFDCVFAHNDRMAMGARRAAEKHGLDLSHIKFCGIDAMPQNGGGMELVDNGTLFASYTYPTRGDAYFVLTIDPADALTYGWYDFTVPFEVEISNGIYRYGENTPMRSGVDFMIMEYSESRRASGMKGWVNASGTLQPGRAYTITLDKWAYTTYVFKKKTGASTTGTNSFNAVASDVESQTRGWNGLGNGSLSHAQLTDAFSNAKV